MRWTLTRLERFWSKVAVGAPDQCWEWQASLRTDGYGQFDRRGAHRVAYELSVGPIPDGLQIDHPCRNIKCVNPAHLEAVTQRENTLRSLPYKAKPTRHHGECHIGYQKRYLSRRAGSDA